jgi:hypothetical protein
MFVDPSRDVHVAGIPVCSTQRKGIRDETYQKGLAELVKSA